MTSNAQDRAEGVGPTPGPWRAECEGDWWMVYSDTAELLPDFKRGQLPVVDLFHGGYDFADAGWPLSANARLIAAAPDLLAALEWLCEQMVAEQDAGVSGFEDWLAPARAAIARARGAA